MFSIRRQPTSPVPETIPTVLDMLLGMSEKEQRAMADQMVQSGEWLQADADYGVRLARRLETFVVVESERDPSA